MHGEELLKNERGSGGGGLYREYTCVQIEEGEKGRRREGETSAIRKLTFRVNGSGNRSQRGEYVHFSV